MGQPGAEAGGWLLPGICMFLPVQLCVHVVLTVLVTTNTTVVVKLSVNTKTHNEIIHKALLGRRFKYIT